MISKTGETAYLFNKQDRNDLIGQGGFHLVFKATRDYDINAFCIRISKDSLKYLTEKNIFQYTESARVQKTLNHPLIVGIVDDFIDSDGHQCVV